ncbi:MAG: N-acetylmuramoyl-L-alanine amidase CwlD [Clostridium sp.]
MDKIKLSTVFLCLLIIFTGPIKVKAIINQNSERIILIDPGHGGFDGGAQSKAGTIEKGINLEISQKLKIKLERDGYKVVMTRDSDEGLYTKGTTIREKKREDLKKRCEMKKETNCDVFISIHQNMFAQSKCYGGQVWYASNEKSSLLAKNIQGSLREIVDNGNKREAKSAGDAYLILRDKYDGASVLVECGFLSNPDEEAKLKTQEHQEKLVDALILGINRYFEGINSLNG